MTTYDTSQPTSAGEWRKNPDGTWFLVPRLSSGISSSTTVSSDGDGGGNGGGGGDAHYIHTQSVLAKVWTVIHNLNKHPAVAITDAAGTVVAATVRHLSTSTLTVTFHNAATGTVYCN